MNDVDPATPFPVLYQGGGDAQFLKENPDAPRSVPWGLLAPHEAQVLRNHDQTLKRLAERGGLGLSEMVAILEDRRFERMLRKDALAQVRVFVAKYEAAKR